MRKIVSKFFWPAFEVVIAGIFVVLVMPRNKDEKLVFTVENKVEEVKEEEKKEEEPKVEEKPVVKYDPIDTSNYPVLNSYTNLVMTGYGYDCRGCTTGKTASGYSIRDTIYYDDPTFGTLRIVAMDKSIPMYSIVRISNINGMEPILAIVLDRGGGISFSKSIQIDLVVESEAIAKTTIGKKYNVTCDILRSGK